MELSDAQAFETLLERLGMRPSFFYDKYRTEFAASTSAGLAMLDETPIGNFIELEGPSRWIDRTAARMGFREEDYITASYARLYFEQTGKKLPVRMVFGPRQE